MANTLRKLFITNLLLICLIVSIGAIPFCSSLSNNQLNEVTKLILVLSVLLLLVALLLTKKLTIELTKSNKNLEFISSKNLLLTTALDNVDFGVCIKDRDNAIKYFNKYYSGLFENITQILYNPQDSGSQYLNLGEENIPHRIKIVDDNLEGISTAIIYNADQESKIYQELQLSTKAQAGLLESIAIASAVFTSNRKLKFYNQAFVKLWNLDEVFLKKMPRYEEILDKLHHQRKLPEYANYSKFRKDQLNLFISLEKTIGDLYHLPDGRSLNILIIPHALGGLLFSYEDITDRIALESSYNTLARAQYATINNLQEAVCVIGENSRVELFNAKFADLWRLDIEFLDSKPRIKEMIERCKPLFNSEKDFAEHRFKVYETYENRYTSSFLVKVTNDISINRFVVPLPSGSTLISDLDVTASIEVKQALSDKNTALENVHQMKSQFLENISYELRSPLTSIIGYSEMLKSSYIGILNSKQNSYVDYILSSASKLAGLIDDVIDLTSAENNDSPLLLTKFDIEKAVKEVIIAREEQLAEAELECELVLNFKEQLFLRADRGRFQQIIQKILSNSIEYSHKQQKIIIIIELEHNYVLIKIIDQGVGIPQGEQAFIFEKFYKANNLKILRRSGAGLGLSIVKKFMDLHQGEIELFSVENEGTTFICKFLLDNYDSQRLQDLERI